MQSSVQHHVLIVSPMADITQVAESLNISLGCPVKVANARRLRLLSH